MPTRVVKEKPKKEWEDLFSIRVRRVGNREVTHTLGGLSIRHIPWKVSTPGEKALKVGIGVIFLVMVIGLVMI